MHDAVRAAIVTLAAWLLAGTQASAQSVAPISVDSAIGVNQFVGANGDERPAIVVDVTASMRIGKGWTAYVRPWFRKAPNDPYDLAKEIYQAALQYQRNGRVSTRVDLGYILSPIGLGMLDMRPDTNPTITPHLSYLIPMPGFDAGVPSSLPIASSYPLGGQFTASTMNWDARAAIVTAPPNRQFVLHAASPNPVSRPTVIVGGGVTPRAGLRVGLAYAGGEYAKATELTRSPLRGRRLHMVAAEGEFAFGYTRLTAEFTRDSLETGTGHAVATAWFVQGTQSISPRWFVAGRHEGANAPPRTIGTATPTLRISEATVGFRLTEDFTLRSGYVTRKTYFSPVTNRQVGVSLVWAHRWL